MSMYQPMKVDLLDCMGTDITVVNAARVSFNNESGYEMREVGWEEGELISVPMIKDKDKKLIRYLAKHKHWSPFSHCFLQFRVEAPMFVARQLAKHQVGLSWNEVSRRYVDDDIMFYWPEEWRGRAANNKQGSEGTIKQTDFAQRAFEMANVYAHSTYMDLLSWGVAPEQARMVLPQHTMTQWYWSGSLYAFARVCQQRLDDNSQQETAEVANMIYDHCADSFPCSWDALMEQPTLQGDNDNGEK